MNIKNQSRNFILKKCHRYTDRDYAVYRFIDFTKMFNSCDSLTNKLKQIRA